MVAFILNLSLGSVAIPVKEIIKALFNIETQNPSWTFIIQEYRLPKAITAILAGAALSISGLLMQTFFKNPLAGPFVLGISSGASLGVALLIMGSALLGGVFAAQANSTWAIVIAASAGSALVMFAVLSVTYRVQDTMAILIIGLMFGSLTTAVVGILAYFSSAEQIQQYIFWSYGSLGNNTWQSIKILTLCITAGLLLTIAAIKPLNALLLGQNYAQTQGINIKKTNYIIIASTCILAGTVTAFAGPIAFIGLAVPHITRQFFTTSNHKTLLPAVIIIGALIMLLCDTLAQLPFSNHTLPINAITSLVGAPIVIWIIIKKRHLFF